MWQQWLNLIVGLWIVLSSYLGFSIETMAANFTISGLVVVGLSLWGALQHNMMLEDDRLHSHI